jgi:hypothetical protein
MQFSESFLQPFSVRTLRFPIGMMFALLVMLPLSAGATTSQLASTPPILRFGGGVVGQTETLLVTVTNTGQTTVTLWGISRNNSQLTTSNVDLPLVLQAAQSIDLSVSFTPTAEGRTNGNVTVSSDASNPTLVLDVVGDAIASANTPIAGNRGQTVYSISSQEPASQNEYAGSPMGTPLPGDTESHCLTNVTCSNTSPDKAIINCTFGGNCSTGTGGSEVQASSSSVAYCPSCANGGALGSAGAYYCSSTTCPIYKIVSAGHCPQNSAYCPTAKYFHLPSKAQWGSSVGGDNYLIVWDQSTDGSAGNTTTGGRRLTAYQYSSSAGLVTLPANTCFSESCAVQISLPGYAEFGYPGTQTVVFQEGSGAWSSSGIAGSAGIIRGAEWVAGTINHAIILNANCLSGAVYYPAPINAAKICTDGLPYHIGEGMLVKIKSSFNCSSVLPYQQPLCLALKTYGGYVGDTTGTVCSSFTCTGVWPARIEGGAAYNMAGIEYPFMATYLNGASGVACYGGTFNNTPAKCSLTAPLDMTGLVTGDNLEVIDQCIVKRMAGVAGAC